MSGNQHRCLCRLPPIERGNNCRKIIGGWDEAGKDILSVPSSTSMLDRVLQCIRWVLYVFEVVGVLEQSYRSLMMDIMDMMDRLSTRRRTAVLIPTS